MDIKKVLHVGCGPARKEQMPAAFHGDEWQEVRCDIDASVEPDIVADMRDLAGVEDASFDAVYSSHNIEHVFAHEVPLVLSEFARVLKPDGFLVITCPDVQSLGEALAQGRLLDTLYVSPAGPIAAIDILWGHRASIAAGKIYMAHKVGLTAQALADTLGASGFGSALCARHPASFALWALATREKMDQDGLLSLRQQFLPV
ncbi:MAG: methyltransferase domain-containing protein [Thiomonas sp.]